MATQDQSTQKKKRRVPATLLWGLLGLVILLAGAASALYYMNRERIAGDARLKVIQDFAAKVDQTIQRGKATLGETIERGKQMAGMEGKEGQPAMAPPPVPPRFGAGGSRLYTVMPGDNLWSIARESGLVDNPWEWRTILLQNADKIDYAFISQETGSWMIMMAEGQELEVAPDSEPNRVPGEGKKFAIQLASVSEEQFNRAVQVARVLMRDGYYAYVYPGDRDGRRYYRIRSGFYDSEAKATALGEEIRERYTKQNYFPEKVWVMEPGDAELRGDEMVFGAQLVNPWVIELQGRDSHAQALADLRKVRGNGHFAYIMQVRNPTTRRFIYRVRVGFFNSESSAKDYFSGQGGEVWEDARTTKTDHFEETLPGQAHKLGEPVP